jgi:D-lactate dehydrogenase (quinone)
LLHWRRDVALDNPTDLPISMEYMDRDAFDVVDRAGRVLGTTIKVVGTSSPIVSKLWKVKLWIEGLPFDGAQHFVDKLLYTINPIFPSTLPREIMNIGRDNDHHVAMSVGDFGDGSMDRLLDRMKGFATKHGRDKITIYECKTPTEARGLMAFRFVAAPAFRTWCVGEGMQGYSVDYALPKNEGSAPPLSSSTSTTSVQPVRRMRYSHFACNVVHEDLAYGPGVDIHAAKYDLKRVVEHECGGKLPAEHGHGTEYIAPPETQERWKKMDPLNVMNPGVGGLSENFKYES